MKVLHLAYYYGQNTSGAPMAAARLHHALLRRGVESHFLCVEAKDSGVHIHSVPHSRILSELFYLLTRFIWVFSRIVLGRMLMPNLLPLFGFLRAVHKIDPDVIHVHCISQDMVSFSQLKQLKTPFVVTAHDFTLLNALDPHPNGDERYVVGFLKSNSQWFERWLWNRKKNLISSIRPIFSAPSNWAASIVEKAAISRECDLKVVPNVVDPVFCFNNKLRIAHQKFTIVYGAFKGRSAAKGWDDLVSSLAFLPNNIKNDIQVSVFGELAEDYEVNGVLVKFLGPINNLDELVSVYHHSDVCAFPSKMETQGQVKSEALLCGLPVLAFDRTACAEGISKFNGWVSADGDVADYAAGIQYYYQLFKNGKLEEMHPLIAMKASQKSDETKIVNEYISLYEQAICGGHL